MLINQATPLSYQHVYPSTPNTAQRDGVVCYIWPRRSVPTYVRLLIMSWLHLPSQGIRVLPLLGHSFCATSVCCLKRILCTWSEPNEVAVVFLFHWIFCFVFFPPTDLINYWKRSSSFSANRPCYLLKFSGIFLIPITPHTPQLT